MKEKDLIYFCTLVETGSYTQTAEKFKVTQPTISLAIKRLPKELEDPIITQSSRKGPLKLTVAGKLLYKNLFSY